MGEKMPYGDPRVKIHIAMHTSEKPYGGNQCEDHRYRLSDLNTTDSIHKCLIYLYKSDIFLSYNIYSMNMYKESFKIVLTNEQTYSKCITQNNSQLNDKCGAILNNSRGKLLLMFNLIIVLQSNYYLLVKQCHTIVNLNLVTHFDYYLLVTQCHTIMNYSLLVLSISSLKQFTLNITNLSGYIYQICTLENIESLQSNSYKKSQNSTWLHLLNISLNSQTDAKIIKNNENLYLSHDKLNIRTPKNCETSESEATCCIQPIPIILCTSLVRTEVYNIISRFYLLASSKSNGETIYGEQSYITQIYSTIKYHINISNITKTFLQNANLHTLQN